MKITFLGQGFEVESPNAIGYHLMLYLEQTTFHSFTGISAFASEAGIFGLAGYIQRAKQNYHIPKKITLIVGVDQQGTSMEALKELKDLNVDSYIYHQLEFQIFHPKIYLFEGDEQTKLIVGSSNLTGSGLFMNIESSLLVEFDNNDTEGRTLLNELKTYFHTLFDLSDPNLFQISDSVIADFENKGIIPNEAQRRKKITHNTLNSNQQTSEQQNCIIIPSRNTVSIPSSFPRKSTTRSYSDTLPSAIPNPLINNSLTPQANSNLNQFLVWQKLNLSQSDAQSVPVGTAITGNLKLSQARFRINNLFIDQKSYFRNIIFNNLTWVKTKPNNNTYEETFCPFDITILGIRIGEFYLKLSHDPVRIAGQGNTPTWLHWGNNLILLLQQNNIIGKTLNLYVIGESFSIEII